MKRLFPILAVLCVLAGAFTSCKPKIEYTESDLLGKWQAPSTSAIDPEGNYKYIVFKADVDSETSKKLGYEWDEGDDVHESDLTYKGNGYFLWVLSEDQLTLTQRMENGWAEFDKVYTITTLTSTTLTYEDDFGKMQTWTRK